MLSNDQIALLSWLSQQSDSVTLSYMEQQNAPGYTHQRLESLRKSGHIFRDIDINDDGQLVGVYTLGDKGSAALSEIAEYQQAKADEYAKEKRTRRFQLIDAAVGAVIALLIEHIPDMIRFLRGLFG